MATVHVTEAEAARDFGGVLARVRAGDEVLIESGDGTVRHGRIVGPLTCR